MAAPALVIKGACDYLSWSSGLAYRQALPNARLVYLHHAGHNAYQDQPAAYMAVVRAFLTGQPLPIAPSAGSGAPADYHTKSATVSHLVELAVRAPAAPWHTCHGWRP